MSLQQEKIEIFDDSHEKTKIKKTNLLEQKNSGIYIPPHKRRQIEKSEEKKGIQNFCLTKK